MKKRKKSTADLIRAVLFAVCALTWLPDWPVERVSWLRAALFVACAAAAAWSLTRYFKGRRAGSEES